MSTYEDGTFTVPIQNGTRRIRFPFITATAQDKYARVHERDFVVQSPLYIPVSTDRVSITNLLLYSEQFDNAAWTKTSSTVSANSVANPMDGATTADALLEVAASAEHTITQAAVIAASAVTLSVCVSALNRDWARLKITDSAAGVKTAFFNVTTGALGTVDSGATSDMVMIVPGWYRCSLTYTSPAAGSATASIQPSTDGSTVSYLGVITNGLYLFGAQMEQAAAPLQYASTTTIARNISAPPTDDTQNGSSDPYADPYAFLCGELIPEVWGGKAPYFQFTRPYARIPGTQVTYPGARYIPLPSVTNDFAGLTSLPVFVQDGVVQVIGNGFYNSAAGAIYTEYQNSLFGPTKTAGGRIPGYATAGTFTLTYGASTTAALNWNDSGATIATALNGLASVTAAGLTASVSNALATVTGGGLVITWSVGYTTSPVTMNATGLTLSTSNHPITQITSKQAQDILLPDHLTVTSHGFNAAVSLATVYGTRNSIGVGPTATWGVIDANTIWLPTASIYGEVNFVAAFKQTYIPGRVYLVRTRLTEDFFLPGVSVGITTAADIPIDVGLQNPTDFISALLNLTGWQNYETEGPAFWLNGPIYRRAYLAIFLADFA